MRQRLALVLALLVLAPLVSLAWLGLRLAEDERLAVRARFTAVVDARLTETAGVVDRLLAQRERELLAATEAFPDDPALVRPLLRRARAFSHALVFDPEGRLLFPPVSDDPALTSDAERRFLERTRGLWGARTFRHRPDAEDGDATRDHGWHIWYWGGGLNLMFWRRQPDGRTVVVEVDRVRLLADVVAVLPATGDAAGERTALLDSSGQVIYQWGDWEPPPGAAPRLERALAAPLQAWRLAWWGEEAAEDGGDFTVLAGVAAVALALFGLAAWFYRESARDLREAAERVSFVNQVSHELKTPLTNIRMYAELLEDELTDEHERAARYVRVVVQESQRLSRLIANVLSFARARRDQLQIRRGAAVADEVVRDVVEQFAPSLEAVGVSPELHLGAPEAMELDADALGQILGNLLSNVEKYAASGGRVEIRTEAAPGELRLTVRDHGPGIPGHARARVFEPFQRLGEGLSDVAGTGIGLGIARDLARLHGGDLTLEPGDGGATFLLRLRT